MENTIELKHKILKNKETFLEKNTLYGVLTTELLDFLGEDLITAPASSMTSLHNAFPGGLVDHILKTTKYAIGINKLLPENVQVDAHSIIKVCFLHQIGKTFLYKPNDSEWHRKNQGKMYKINPNNPFTLVNDLSIWLLQHYGIEITWNEMLGIKLTDGLYDESNKPYYISRSADSKLKTNLGYVMHQADSMAARIEYERWNNNKPIKTASVKRPTKTITCMLY